MEKKRLTQEIEVAPLAFGGNVFGWTVDEPTSFELLDHFEGAGFNLIDTADVYSNWKPGNKGGESETIIGNWLKRKGNRTRMVIATKVGGDMGQGKTLKKNYILKAAEDSLRRLKTDYMDLYQTHWDDLSTPVEETLEAYAQLIRQGKVRAIGASNLSADRLKASLQFSEQNGMPRYQTLQPEYNLYNRQKFELEYESICREKGLRVINYYALASGFLTGKYRSQADVEKSPRGGGVVKSYLNERGLRILGALDEVAKRFQSNPAGVSLAWLLSKPTIAAPIASATSVHQLDELMKATRIPLDQDAIALLEKASAYSP